jgi:hypothetical protein
VVESGSLLTSCSPSREPRVRIPASPPKKKDQNFWSFFFIDEAISLLGEHTAELDRLEQEYVNEVNAAVEQGEKDLSQVEA